IALLSALLIPSLATAAVTVCVDVEVKSWTQAPPETSTEVTENDPERPFDPFAIDPARYLERMTRYEVTHEVGFEAVDEGCAEHLTIELYPLRDGWTVFARYSGHSREEKVDHVELDEFVALAQRLTTALLGDQPVSDTINRENVLRADSKADLRTIEGEGHFVLALGTQVRVGKLPTGAGANPATDELRVLTPLSFQLGYRGKYQAWGLDAFLRGAVGTSSQAPRRNSGGGHADFDGSAAFGLHFLRYLDARGVTSMYFGGGAVFQLSRFSIVRAEADWRDDEKTESLYGGGLDVDLVLGCEFMRASSVHFFVQGELQAPTYRFETEVDAGGLDVYLPGGLLQIGMVF
ncbi:MAG: hypothetical protein KC620_22070, partial [Myxococcales bacterium]|nr:hypothetical protein [Myxococcales bacterium]